MDSKVKDTVIPIKTSTKKVRTKRSSYYCTKQATQRVNSSLSINETSSIYSVRKELIWYVLLKGNPPLLFKQDCENASRN